ncbi:MAG: hemolysin family protein, partial [Acidimicrobiales bacterium]
QRAERWGLLAARPLALFSALTRPVVWLLSHSTDLAVRLMGGEPKREREEVTEEELRDMVGAHRAFTPEQRTIISGAFEIAERTLGQVMRPRRAVVVLSANTACVDALEVLVTSGHSRAPVADGGDLDHVVGVVHLRDLIGGGDVPVRDRVNPPMVLPESAHVLHAFRDLKESRQQLAVVVDEFGGGAGIVTVEDLLEELVGEIYDETDRDVLTVERDADGAIVVPGSFPVHDLVDVGVELPQGDYATVAGLVLTVLGRIPDSSGDRVEIDGWVVTVLAVEDRAITRVRLSRGSEDGSPAQYAGAP